MLYVDLKNDDGTIETIAMPANAVYCVCEKCGQKWSMGGYLHTVDGENFTENYSCPDCEEEKRKAESEKKRLSFCKKHCLPEVWTEDTLKELLAHKGEK